MNVVSLFDGISGLAVALKKSNIPTTKYYASEVDKHAIKVSAEHFPDIERLGDVREVAYIPGVDLLCGGSPCQDLSIAKPGREGLEGAKSSLFWEYVRLKTLLCPKWFILENVASMHKDDRDIITKEMGVEPIMINASHFSAQSRKRLFWTNIPVDMSHLPVSDAVVADILEKDVSNKSISVASQPFAVREIKRKSVKSQCLCLGKIGDGKFSTGNRVYSTDGKSGCLTTGRSEWYNVGGLIRRLTPVEAERLQGLPDGYTQSVSKTQRLHGVGNGFNVDVIAFILSFIPRP